MSSPRGKIVYKGMLRENTPVEYHDGYNLWVKREDKACPFPGPPFSKARGVYVRIASRPERVIGCLDTYHSQGGHATARACQILGKQCLVFYPEFKHEPGYREPQAKAKSLGAKLVGLPAGRSSILYHAAKKQTEAIGGYMLPNALKLEESVNETAREVPDVEFDQVLVSASSGTIAAGVIKGFFQKGLEIKEYIIHLGYTRSHDQLLKYMASMSGVAQAPIKIVDELYGYKDEAKPGTTPPWPCNYYYDLKAFRWWIKEGRSLYSRGKTLFWNIG